MPITTAMVATMTFQGWYTILESKCRRFSLFIKFLLCRVRALQQRRRSGAKPDTSATNFVISQSTQLRTTDSVRLTAVGFDSMALRTDSEDAPSHQGGERMHRRALVCQPQVMYLNANFSENMSRCVANQQRRSFSVYETTIYTSYHRDIHFFWLR